MECIRVPVAVAKMGEKAVWLYTYLALLEMEGKPIPPERKLADIIGIDRSKLRRLKMSFEPSLNQERTKSEPSLNQVGTEIQQVTEQSEPSLNQERTKFEPSLNQTKEKESLPPAPPTENKENPKNKKEIFIDKEKNKRVFDDAVESFRLSLDPYKLGNERTDGVKTQYPAEMVDDFFSYWSEPNKSRTKMRQQTERTWETGRRLATWARNNSRFSRGNELQIGQVIDTKGKDFGGW